MIENEFIQFYDNSESSENIAVEVDGDIVVPDDAPDGGDNSWSDSGINEEGGGDE